MTPGKFACCDGSHSDPDLPDPDLPLGEGASYNWGAGPISGSFPVDQAGNIMGYSYGPGTGFRVGASMSGGTTWAVPYDLPEDVEDYILRGPIPNF